jgi:hypothetical protein
MIIHWGRPIPGWIIFGVMVLVFLCATFYSPENPPSDNYVSESVTGPEYTSPLNDSLPHFQYKQIEDSINREKAIDNFFANSSGSGISFSDLGIASYGRKEQKQYFFTIVGYRLGNFVTIENKKTGTFINYPVWDKIGENSRDGHLENKQISIKYEEAKEPTEGKILLPINKRLGLFIEILFYAVAILMAVFSFYAIIFIPIRFLLQIAKGKAFTEENIGSLYLTAWTLIGFSLLAGFLKVTAHLLAKSQIPEGIDFSIYAAIMKSWKTLVAGLAVLLLAKAFLQGLYLKEEQDLTV